MTSLRYLRADVFTDRPLCGNPLAVFPDAQGVDAATLQAIAREMNLSETVFCVPPADPSAAVRLRIFTVDRELPLAGHPTIGTVHALVATGRLSPDPDGIVRVELGAGVLPVAVERDGARVVRVVMTQRTPRFGPVVEDRELLARALGCPVEHLVDAPARVVDTGIPWLLVELSGSEAVRALAPDPAACARLARHAGTDMFHAFTARPEPPDCDVHTRHVFFGTVTPGEDPATGSAAGCLAAHLVERGTVTALPAAELAIRQGAEIGRPGRITACVDVRDGRIERVRVAGSTVVVGEGELRW